MRVVFEWWVPVAMAVCAHVGVAVLPVGSPSGAPETPPVRAQLRLPPPPPPPEPPPPVATPAPEEPPPVRARRTTPAPRPPVPVPPEAELLPAPEVPALAPVSRAPHALAATPLPEAPPPPPPRPPAPRIDLDGYRDGIQRAMHTVKRYPRMARSLGLEGHAEVIITIGRDGTLAAEPTLSRSSGHAVLDEEVLRMARAAAPFPPLPAGYPHERARLQVPVAFDLRL
jgi:periplasmic protein TonB